MKRTFYLATMFVVAAVSSGLAQAPQGEGRRGGGPGRGGPPACETIACEVEQDWARGAALLIGVAEAMPEDKFSFKPTPAQQSFAERLMHVVQIDLKLLGSLGGSTAAPTINASAMTKKEAVAALQQWRDYGSAVVKGFNDQQLTERVKSMPFMGPTTSRLRVINFSISHGQDIYGQLVVYLRLNGVTPPASNRP